MTDKAMGWRDVAARMRMTAANGSERTFTYTIHTAIECTPVLQMKINLCKHKKGCFTTCIYLHVDIVHSVRMDERRSGMVRVFLCNLRQQETAIGHE